MMVKYSEEELNKILYDHKKWIVPGDGEKADLSGADLSGADLSGADLRGADLSGANLSGADLRGANLSGANLRCANLSGANLSGANLRCANLSSADLSNANLRYANLRGADLSNANLRYAIGNLSDVFCIQSKKYHITYTNHVMAIGCEQHTIKDWFDFDDITISKMDNDALEWWKKWKPMLKQIIGDSFND